MCGTVEYLSRIVPDNEAPNPVRNPMLKLPAMLLKKKISFPLQGSRKNAFSSPEGLWWVRTVHFFVVDYICNQSNKATRRNLCSFFMFHALGVSKINQYYR